MSVPWVRTTSEPVCRFLEETFHESRHQGRHLAPVVRPSLVRSRARLRASRRQRSRRLPWRHRRPAAGEREGSARLQRLLLGRAREVPRLGHGPARRGAAGREPHLHGFHPEPDRLGCPPGAAFHAARLTQDRHAAIATGRDAVRAEPAGHQLRSGRGPREADQSATTNLRRSRAV